MDLEDVLASKIDDLCKSQLRPKPSRHQRVELVRVSRAVYREWDQCDTGEPIDMSPERILRAAVKRVRGCAAMSLTTKK
jgi:hypothetical protein